MTPKEKAAELITHFEKEIGNHDLACKAALICVSRIEAGIHEYGKNSMELQNMEWIFRYWQSVENEIKRQYDAFVNTSETIPANWNEPQGDTLSVPDRLMPLFDKVAMQLRFHTISGKNEVCTIADIVECSRQFFREHPETLKSN